MTFQEGWSPTSQVALDLPGRVNVELDLHTRDILLYSIGWLVYDFCFLLEYNGTPKSLATNYLAKDATRAFDKAKERRMRKEEMFQEELLGTSPMLWVTDVIGIILRRWRLVQITFLFAVVRHRPLVYVNIILYSFNI